MKTIVIGLGVQGEKRKNFCGEDYLFSVDPYNKNSEFNNLDDVDFNLFESAMLCVPDNMKLEYIKQLVSNGKNVLVEKPLNLTQNDSNNIAALANKNNATVYVAYNHRFEPNWITAKNLIDENKIGDIYKVNLFYGNGTAELVRNSAWRDRDLGVIPDLASHLFDLVDFWFGIDKYDIEVISAHKFENKSFDNAVIKLIGKPEVILEVSLLSWRNSFWAELVGSTGSIHLDSLCKWGPSKLILSDRKRPSGKPEEKITLMDCPDPTWKAEYIHFKNLVKNGNSGNLDTNYKISQIFYALERSL